MNVTATLFGQIGTFIVLVWFVMRFLWEPVIQLMEDRKKRIADGLAAADKGHHDLELAKEHAVGVIRKAKEQAKDVIAHANKRSNEIIDEAKVSAREEGERLIDGARAEIEQERNQAREKLRQEVVKLAMTGAAQVLSREVDTEAHNAQLQKLAEQL